MRTYHQYKNLALSRDFQIAAIRAAQGLPPDPDRHFAAAFGGAYTLIKTEHGAPAEHISVGRLTIGENVNAQGSPSIFDCAYVEDGGDPTSGIVATGLLVPLEDRATIILNGFNNGNVYIHIDHMLGSSSRNAFNALAGIWVSALDKWQPSAAPIYAKRIDAGESTPSSLSSTSIDNLPPPVRERLQLGVIRPPSGDYP